MRSIFVSLLGLTTLAASAQINPNTQINWTETTGPGSPSLTCPGTPPTGVAVGTPYFNTSLNAGYTCAAAGWTLSGGGGGGGYPGVTSDGSGGIVVTGQVAPANLLATGSVEGQTIGPVFQCDQYTGTTIAEKANACITAAIAANATADLRKVMSGGTFASPVVGDEEIDCGSPTTGGGLPGVSCIFPNSSVYATSQVGGPLYAAQPYISGSSGAEGSGYTVGCTVTAPETGYGYTGTATGAVLAVATLDTVVGGGAVKTLTVSTAGSGYLSSPYVPASNTGGTCVGTGLLLRVQAKDSAIRVWGSSTAKTDSVGGGGATFVIEPYYPSGCPGYPVMDSGLSTPKFGGYSRIEGGFKILSGICHSYTYGAFRANGQVDSARNLLIETSTPHDNGIYLESECCSGDNYLLHADAAGTGGTPVIVGGQSLLNACTTNGSSNVYAPYALPTIAWLGNVITGAGIPNNTIVGSLTAPVGAFPASLNLTTQSGTPVNATATTSGSGACITPSVSAGTSGLRLKLSDPTDVSGQLQTISIHNLVPNDPGVGFPMISVGNSANSITFDTVYAERNVTDNYTPGLYGSSLSFVHLNNVRGLGATNAYGILNDQGSAPWQWSATNMSAMGLGLNDNGTVYVNADGVDFFKYLATGNLFMSTFPTFALTGPYNNTAGATAIVNCPATGGSSSTYCGGDGAWHTSSAGGGNYQQFTLYNSTAVSIAGSQTDFIGTGGSPESGLSGQVPQAIAVASCTVYAVNYGIQVAGTLDTGANAITYEIVKNSGALSDTLSSTLTAQTTRGGQVSLTGLNTDTLVAGDLLALKLVTPAWTTQPAGVVYTATIFCK